MDIINPDQEFIRRWLEGQLSEEELAELEREDRLAPWINGASHFKVPASQTHEEAWNALLARMESTGKPPLRKKVYAMNWAWASIAATILVCAMAYIFWPVPLKQVYAQKGNQVSYILPDGSEVILNAQSTLSFDPGQWDQNRGFFLSGEAWIHAEKGSKFQVRTALGNVEVLGTEFNVYARDNHLDVACFTGSVAVSAEANRHILNPGEGVKTDNAGMLSLYKTDEQRVLGWKKGAFYFDKVPFKFVIQELERQFDVEVLYSPTIARRTYTGFFTKGKLDDALEMLCAPMNLQYQLEDNNTRISLVE